MVFHLYRDRLTGRYNYGMLEFRTNNEPYEIVQVLNVHNVYTYTNMYTIGLICTTGGSPGSFVNVKSFSHLFSLVKWKYEKCLNVQMDGFNGLKMGSESEREYLKMKCAIIRWGV